MKICKGCNQSVGDQDAYCSRCGTPTHAGGQPDETPNPDHTSKRYTDAHNIRDDASNDTAENVSYQHTVPESDTVIDTSQNYADSERFSPYDAERSVANMPAVDRKTHFDDGMLVLTHEDLVLYGGDEKDEIKRIPLRSMASCSGGTVNRFLRQTLESGTGGRLKRSLSIKKRENIEKNFANYRNDLTAKIEKEKIELGRIKGKVANTTREYKKISADVQNVQTKISEMDRELDKLQTDSKYIDEIKIKKADIKTESFQASSVCADPDREYDIWEHAINRRLEGIKKIRVSTVPPNAIVVIDGLVYHSTPCVIDKPLTEESALSGKHKLEIFLEGHKPKNVTVDARPKSDSKNIEVRLETRDIASDSADADIRLLREKLPDQSIDITQYDIEYEAIGVGHRLLLGRDQLMMVSDDAKRYLLIIPYGAIKQVRANKKFMKGIRGISIWYNDSVFSKVRQDFAIDVTAYSNSPREVNHRYEALLERLERKNEAPYTKTGPVLRRSADYYNISETDITNWFERFDPYSFEKLIAALFEKKGYKTMVTPGSRDMGADVVAKSNTGNIVIQVKKWSANVGGPDVHKTLGSMVSHNATRAIVITTSDFTNQAYEIQNAGSPVELWNGKRLVSEMRRHLMEE